MYVGSEEHRLLFEKLKTLCPSHFLIEQPEFKPGTLIHVCAKNSTNIIVGGFSVSIGQLELQERLGNDQKRLDNLKKKLQVLLATLNTLNEKNVLFARLLDQLLPWLQDQVASAKSLVISKPLYQLLQEQLIKCQVRYQLSCGIC